MQVRRRVLFVDDLARACIHIMKLKKEKYDCFTRPMLSHINVGSGNEISIGELAKLIKKVVGFEGKINYDKSKPDGSPQKLMDSSLINSLGWFPKISLNAGLKISYENFIDKNKDILQRIK